MDMENLFREIQDLEHGMKSGNLSKKELIDALLDLFGRMSSQEKNEGLDNALESGGHINKLIEQNKRILELYQAVLKKQFGVWLTEKDIMTITEND